eukprot:jgi/Picre1/29936/NNA_005314.t1
MGATHGVVGLRNPQQRCHGSNLRRRCSYFGNRKHNLIGMRGIVAQGLPGWLSGIGGGSGKNAEGPPKPNTSKFKKEDLKRIKNEGPTMDDLRAHFEVPKRGEDKNVYDFVPYEVLGGSNIIQSQSGQI